MDNLYHFTSIVWIGRPKRRTWVSGFIKRKDNQDVDALVRKSIEETVQLKRIYYEIIQISRYTENNLNYVTIHTMRED